MSLAARAILLREELKRKKCKRCGLPLSEKLKDNKCPHCGHLSDAELERFLEENNLPTEKDSALPSFLIFAGIILLAIVILSVFVK